MLKLFLWFADSCVPHSRTKSSPAFNFLFRKIWFRDQHYMRGLDSASYRDFLRKPPPEVFVL